MAKCFICGIVLTSENGSDEHILLNCSGGRIHSEDLLCKIHNSEMGEKADVELCEQINQFSNLMKISRKRGDPAPFFAEGVESGRRFKVFPGGKPEFDKPRVLEKKSSNRVEIEITARSEKELNGILDGFHRKYPKFDHVEALKSAKFESHQMAEAVQMNFSYGGPLAFKSVLKTFVGYYIHNGGDPKFVAHLIPILKDTYEGDVPVGIFLDGNVLYERKSGSVNHLLAMNGNSKSKLLLGYLEYFGAFRFLGLLSKQYDGPDFDHAHYYNPIKVENEVAPRMDWSSGESSIEAVLRGERQSNSGAHSALSDVLPTVMSRSAECAREEMVNTVVADWAEKYRGETITESMIGELSVTVAERFVKMNINRFGPNQPVSD